jgi:uncharacterized protein
MQHRIIGFDLARAWAIFGMYVVNFNVVFGDYQSETLLGQFLHLFNGNSSTVFVTLAGMGVSLLTYRLSADVEQKREWRSLISRRSWFLFVLGMLLYLWWPADILHFYGGYMHLAAWCLFLSNRKLLLMVGGFVLGFHLLFVIFPYDKGWNFDTLVYTDFWTPLGFMRNTLYNGWNPIFPWAAYFFLGMWLGRLNWSDQRVQNRLLGAAFVVFACIETLIFIAGKGLFGPDLGFFFTSDYLPPFLPFLLSTASVSVMLIVIWIKIGMRFGSTRLAQILAATGRMTLSHYILHLTLGMLALAALTGRPFEATLQREKGLMPIYILVFALAWFVLSLVFSWWWQKRYKNGPFESLMRKIAG